MANAWLLLTFGANRQYRGNEGYLDDPEATYRYDSLVPNSRRLAVGDWVVLRDRDAMLGLAVIEQVTARPGVKALRRCPECGTTKFGERHKREPRFRCKRGHEFSAPQLEQRQCDEFEARFGNSFQRATGAVSAAELRTTCKRYTEQLSIQALDIAQITALLTAARIAIPDTEGRGKQKSGREEVGATYRLAFVEGAVPRREPFAVDPSLVDRGNRGHAVTQNALAAFVIDNGLEPRSPVAQEPDYDLAWSDGDAVVVCEVKSVTDENEEKQLRLGLGQVLRYRQLLLGRHRTVTAVLAVERPPRDLRWSELCRDVRVVLVWPGNFVPALGRN